MMRTTTLTADVFRPLEEAVVEWADARRAVAELQRLFSDRSRAADRLVADPSSPCSELARAVDELEAVKTQNAELTARLGGIEQRLDAAMSAIEDLVEKATGGKHPDRSARRAAREFARARSALRSDPSAATMRRFRKATRRLVRATE